MLKEVLRYNRQSAKESARATFGQGSKFAEQYGNPFAYEDYLRGNNVDERNILEKEKVENVKQLKEKTEFAIQKVYEEIKKYTTPQQPAIQ